MDGSFKARPYYAGGRGRGARGTARSQTAAKRVVCEFPAQTTRQVSALKTWNE